MPVFCSGHVPLSKGTNEVGSRSVFWGVHDHYQIVQSWKWNMAQLHSPCFSTNGACPLACLLEGNWAMIGVGSQPRVICADRLLTPCTSRKEPFGAISAKCSEQLPVPVWHVSEHLCSAPPEKTHTFHRSNRTILPSEGPPSDVKVLKRTPTVVFSRPSAWGSGPRGPRYNRRTRRARGERRTNAAERPLFNHTFFLMQIFVAWIYMNLEMVNNDGQWMSMVYISARNC